MGSPGRIDFESSHEEREAPRKYKRNRYFFVIREREQNSKNTCTSFVSAEMMNARRSPGVVRAASQLRRMDVLPEYDIDALTDLGIGSTLSGVALTSPESAVRRAICCLSHRARTSRQGVELIAILERNDICFGDQIKRAGYVITKMTPRFVRASTSGAPA